SEPTIRDVAARAGVSKSLVSLVLRQSPSVSDKRREAVLKAVAELGYRANGLARRLVSGRTHTSGVVVTDLLNPFYAEVLHGINAEARAAAHRLLVVSGADVSEAVDAAEGLLEMRAWAAGYGSCPVTSPNRAGRRRRGRPCAAPGSPPCSP